MVFNGNFKPQNFMAKKFQSRPDGLMYSTNKDFFENYEAENIEQETLVKDKQKLRVQLDTKQRAGKVVTAISGFVGTDEDREALGKMLKTKCGAGGSVKDGLIMVQGDYKNKIITWLVEWGYKNTKG
jgi:translation initiation factor 1